MFPLESVLLPGAILPLHVFEPRYRSLVVDCLAADEHEFGVTMIARGREVGGGEHRMDVGTVARMIEVAEMDDGRYVVVCVGTRRIRVSTWLPDSPYPLAEVDDLPDDETETDAVALVEQIAAMTARVRRATALATELGDSCIDASADISDDPLLATYHLAALAPIGPADTYDLLCASGPARRLALLSEKLDDIEVVLQFRLLHDSTVFIVDDPDAL
jgi:Lon protease-like protein